MKVYQCNYRMQEEVFGKKSPPYELPNPVKTVGVLFYGFIHVIWGIYP